MRGIQMCLVFIRTTTLGACQQTETNYSAGMKANWLICVFLFLFLILGLAATSQTNSPTTVDNTDKQKNEVQMFRKSAENGEILSQRALALFLDIGTISGIDPDPNEAARWYLRAANQGDSESQFSIGEKYMKGEGVSQDFIEAYKWFNIAAASPDKMNWDAITNFPNITAEQIEYLKKLSQPVGVRAKAARDTLAQYMTLNQIVEAQQMAREFKPHKELGFEVSASAKDPTASGSGFFITTDGYLISNYHVVKDATKVRLLTSAGLIDAKVLKVDAANDLALLKADGRAAGKDEGRIMNDETGQKPTAGNPNFILHNSSFNLNFSPLPITSSRSVKLGGTVATVGFPNTGLQGFAPKFARGEIASLSGAADDARYFQISVPVQPGNSGGALVDEHGNVVGVVSAKLNAAAALAASGALPENVNYAVKSSFLLGFLESVPDVASKLKDPVSADRKFEDVVKSAQDAAVLVLVY
ncbi:MAG: tetratricopeptide repeat-containing serine protease family protein [Verrucomicrobiales bacterium]|nr:tetratricopeptide repeat-containing serine protease family protein [Verrucomicrobiales bacterium]